MADPEIEHQKTEDSFGKEVLDEIAL